MQCRMTPCLQAVARSKASKSRIIMGGLLGNTKFLDFGDDLRLPKKHVPCKASEGRIDNRQGRTPSGLLIFVTQHRHNRSGMQKRTASTSRNGNASVAPEAALLLSAVSCLSTSVRARLNCSQTGPASTQGHEGHLGCVRDLLVAVEMQARNKDPSSDEGIVALVVLNPKRLHRMMVSCL